MLLIVNYHYVGLPEFPYPGIHGLSIAEFLGHLKWLKKRFSLVGLSDVLGLIEGGELPPRSCLITFDDGLRCHYDVIVPLMEKHRFPAAFFVSGMPTKENKVTDTHKFQYVRANMSLNELYGKMKLDGVLDDAALKHYRYDDPEVARLKYLVNYLLPQREKSKLIGELFSELISDEESFCEEWYLSSDQIKEMQQKFECIGSHAWSHSPLAMLGNEDTKNEMLNSKNLLEDITGSKIDSLSYPLGSRSAISNRERGLAKEAGYKMAFTNERKVNQCLEDPFMVSRIDCNDLPEVGKQPIFGFENNQMIGLKI